MNDLSLDISWTRVRLPPSPPFKSLKENKMREFLSSKNVSLGCAAINAACAVAAVLSGSWIWFGVSTGLAALCYHNYLKG